MKLGIIGNGFVGKATQGFQSSKVDLLIYDIDPSKCQPWGTTLRDVAFCDLTMIAVPTPMDTDGSCSTKIVEKVIQGLRGENPNVLIMVRSTVPIGFCEEQNCLFMPEFLTEANWPEDFRSNPLWIVGVDGFEDQVRNKMEYILTVAQSEGHIVSNELKIISTKEAEAIKYFRNCFLATKVGFCNEFYDLCQSLGIDFDSMISLASDDKRIGSGHTKVPGPDGKRGFGGTCFPKDLASLVFQFKKRDIPSPLLTSVKLRNETIDRPTLDWKNLEGRAVVAQNKDS